MKSTRTSFKINAHTFYKTFVFAIGFISIMLPYSATAAQATTKKAAKTAVTSKAVVAINGKQNRSPAGLNAGISDSQKELEIRGQSRNLSMLLVLKNRHENIDFVKPRDSYREEIQKTGF